MNIRRLTLFLMLAVLCIAGARQASAFYNPGTGRWLSKDPLEERAGANLYAFTYNRPTLAIDRDGLSVMSLTTFGAVTIPVPKPVIPTPPPGLGPELPPGMPIDQFLDPLASPKAVFDNSDAQALADQARPREACDALAKLSLGKNMFFILQKMREIVLLEQLV